MELAEIISPDRVFEDVSGGSKKKVLETAAGLIAQQFPELDANELFDNLISREKLGSTGLGKGIAIPHCRANHCSCAIGTFIKLESAVDFDAIEASFNRTFRCMGKIIHNTVNIGLSHRSWLYTIDHIAIALFVGNPHLGFYGF